MYYFNNMNITGIFKLPNQIRIHQSFKYKKETNFHWDKVRQTVLPASWKKYISANHITILKDRYKRNVDNDLLYVLKQSSDIQSSNCSLNVLIAGLFIITSIWYTILCTKFQVSYDMEYVNRKSSRLDRIF